MVCALTWMKAVFVVVITHVMAIVIVAFMPNLKTKSRKLFNDGQNATENMHNMQANR